MADYPAGVPTYLEPKNFIKVDTDGAISPSDTTIPLVDASSLPTGGGYLVADNETNEIIQYGGVSGNDLTGCTRGTDGSSPSAQPDSTNLEMRWNAAYLNQSFTNIISIATDLRACFAVDLDDSVTPIAIGTSMENRMDMLATQLKLIVSGVDWKDLPTVTLNALDTEVSGKLSLTGGTMTGSITLTDNGDGIIFGDSGSNTIGIFAPVTVSSSYTLTMPTAQSSGIQLLENNGSGVLSWSSLPLYITNSMVNASAGIVYSKLDLTGGILNADINASAGIVFTKMATMTAQRMVVSDASGLLTPSTWAYVGGVLTTGSQKSLNFQDSTTNFISFKAPASVTTYAVILPNAQGAVDTYMKNDGAGNLTWVTLTGGGGTVSAGLQYEMTYYPTSSNTVNGTPSIKTNATGQLLVSSGLVGTPSYTFTSATNYGMYYSTNQLNFATAGVLRASFTTQLEMNTNIDLNSFDLLGASGIKNASGTNLLPSYAFTLDPDTGMYRDTTNAISFATAGTRRWGIGATGTFSINLGATEQILAANGTAAKPAYSFNVGGATGSGMYYASGGVAIAAGGTASALFIAQSVVSAGETSFFLYDKDNNAVEQVTVGAADSGGSGFKLLRIQN